MSAKDILRSGKCSIFAYNGIIAVGVMNALLILGVDVPNEVQLVGMDNLPIISEFHPRITSVNVLYKQMAETGCEMLLKCIKDSNSPVIQTKIRPELVKKESAL